MGLLDSLVSAASNQAAGNQAAGGLMASVMGLLNHPDVGGLQGLVQKISAGGLQEHVASWVGTGQNLPVSAEQIKSALGSDMVQGMAAKLGVDPELAAHSLASMLPEVVNQLTPNGELPSNEMVQQGLSALTGFFGKA